MSTNGATPLSACPCAGCTLDKLVQPAILTVLAREKLHGYVILQRLAGMPTCDGEKPDATGVYRYLKSMENRGLVRSAWDLSGSRPAKRLYQLTARGRKCLAAWVQTLREYRGSIGKLERLAASSLAARKAATKSERSCKDHTS